MTQKEKNLGTLSASVPPEMESLFLHAQQSVEKYFGASTKDVSQGILRLGGNRHFILRGDALGVEFFKLIRNIYGDLHQTSDLANALLFDLIHAIGAADAKKFIETMGLTDPIEKLSVGPIYFAHAGFARVKIRPDSRPTPDDDFVLFYRHENSFEAESWLESGTTAEKPVCILNTGYASGWCSESFGVPLIAVEYTCKALGDEGCDFVMAPPHRINDYIAQIPDIKHSLYVPNFFGRKEHDKRMQTLAYRDSLTNLSNRAFFTEMSQKVLNLVERQGNVAGLLYFDLDGFKAVNDRFGHAAGDGVLKTVADRLLERFRSNDLIARLGGDEFAILFQEVNSKQDLESIAQEIIEIIGQPIDYRGQRCNVGVSVGGIFFRAGTDFKLGKLINQADAAMYKAKKSGKNRHCIRQYHE